MARLVFCGEAMVELSLAGDAARQCGLHYGGDCLNTAIHLVRFGHDTAFLSALGRDAFSTSLRRQWNQEGLDCSLLLTHPHRNVGLYAIATDAAGERSFTYWRGQSAAREMFLLPDMEQAEREAERADLLFFSLITLAILPQEGRERLFALAAKIRANGGAVGFDGNFRPALWECEAEQQEAMARALTLADFGFATFEDEQARCGTVWPQDVLADWREAGCCEVIVKLGEQGCLALEAGSDQVLKVPVPRAIHPVDTSGAGDAFNAGFLDSRLRGNALEAACRAGHALAAEVICQKGAIPTLNQAAYSPAIGADTSW